MSYLDAALLLALLVSVWYGTRRGLMYEILALIGWAVAYAAAHVAGEATGELLFSALRMDWVLPELRRAIGCGLVFVLVLFFWGALTGLLRRPWNKLTDIKALDRSLGGVFGIVRALVMAWAALLIFAQLPTVQDAVWFQDSVLVPWLVWTLAALLHWLPQLGHMLPAHTLHNA